VFGALVDWNGKIDVKAAFTLTLDTAVLAGVVALARNGVIPELWTKPFWFFAIGGIATLLSALLAVVVVSPILRPRGELSSEVRNGSFIYFGHLSLMDDDTIVEALKGDVLPALVSELKNMSKNAWVKNRLTQVALALVAVGGLLLVLAWPIRGGYFWWSLIPVVVLIAILVFLSRIRSWSWNRLKLAD
jgi:hypothetical protein